MPRLLIVPRWGGGPDSDFYPWLEGALGDRYEVERGTLPTANAPTIDGCVAALSTRLADAPWVLAHSVGCQAVMRSLAASDATIPAALFVAGWFDIDAPWPTIVPWIDTPIDTAPVRERIGRLHVLLSDDDPFTADHGASQARFERELGATVRIVPGGKHFNAREEPEVLAELEEMLSGFTRP